MVEMQNATGRVAGPQGVLTLDTVPQHRPITAARCHARPGTRFAVSLLLAEMFAKRDLLPLATPPPGAVFDYGLVVKTWEISCC